MRTNKLFVCQYCDKTLSSKRSVQCHINVQHGADNPVMYREILADPKDVDTLLGKNKTKTVKCINPVKEVKVVKEICPEPVLNVTELTTGPGVTELSSGHEVAEVNDNQKLTALSVVHEVKDLGTSQEGTELRSSQDLTESSSGQEVTEMRSGRVVTEPRSGLVVTVAKSKPNKNLQNQSAKKEKVSSYDFRKLSNVFSLPVPAQIHLSSNENQYGQDGERSSAGNPSEQFGDQSVGGDCPQKDNPQIQQDMAIHIPSKSIPQVRFKVPYSKKTPRGKCKDWTNCENCSRVADCNECKFCLNSHLK